MTLEIQPVEERRRVGIPWRAPLIEVASDTLAGGVRPHTSYDEWLKITTLPKFKEFAEVVSDWGDAHLEFDRKNIKRITGLFWEDWTLRSNLLLKGASRQYLKALINGDSNVSGFKHLRQIAAHMDQAVLTNVVAKQLLADVSQARHIHEVFNRYHMIFRPVEMAKYGNESIWSDLSEGQFVTLELLRILGLFVCITFPPSLDWAKNYDAECTVKWFSGLGIEDGDRALQELERPTSDFTTCKLLYSSDKGCDNVFMLNEAFFQDDLEVGMWHFVWIHNWTQAMSDDDHFCKMIGDRFLGFCQDFLRDVVAITENQKDTIGALRSKVLGMMMTIFITLMQLLSSGSFLSAINFLKELVA